MIASLSNQELTMSLLWNHLHRLPWALGGSLGKSGSDVVSNVYVYNATMVSSTKAVGIKLYPGGYGTATVSNVTWDNCYSDSL